MRMGPPRLVAKGEIRATFEIMRNNAEYDRRLNEHLKATPSACLQGKRLHIRVMDRLHDPICELKIREGWQPIRLEEALQLHSDRKMRCPVCHGRVDACSADMNGNTAHFKHRISDPGCYLVEAFDG